MIPTQADQPTNSFYNPSKPATYAPEHDTAERVPGRRSTPACPVG